MLVFPLFVFSELLENYVPVPLLSLLSNVFSNCRNCLYELLVESMTFLWITNMSMFAYKTSHKGVHPLDERRLQ